MPNNRIKDATDISQETGLMIGGVSSIPSKGITHENQQQIYRHVITAVRQRTERIRGAG
jgi:hypothetical protein